MALETVLCRVAVAGLMVALGSIAPGEMLLPSSSKEAEKNAPLVVADALCIVPLERAPVQAAPPRSPACQLDDVLMTC